MATSTGSFSQVFFSKEIALRRGSSLAFFSASALVRAEFRGASGRGPSSLSPFCTFTPLDIISLMSSSIFFWFSEISLTALGSVFPKWSPRASLALPSAFMALSITGSRAPAISSLPRLRP
ncbi:hypothetical protein SCALM49S_01259 [Streptomyces californicus]